MIRCTAARGLGFDLGRRIYMQGEFSASQDHPERGAPFLHHLSRGGLDGANGPRLTEGVQKG